MLRWCCLFALLANAIMLLWYSSQVSTSATRVEENIGSTGTLRLVSEINPKSLVWLKPRESELSSCVEFAGFKTIVNAKAVQQLVVEEGFEAEVLAEDKVIQHNYRIALVLPDGLEDRLDTLDYLEQQEGIELQEQALGFEYELMRFKSKKDAELKLSELQVVGISSQVRYDEEQQQRFIVRVFESIDRKLSNKIKEVVLGSYSLEKNEKKVCERVASLKATE
ncbi:MULTISPECIES: hypothetical protein [unclassified Neptuniibacter]|uniref:hypothetical protein n=1 Tax=unclassified Neptuniibacter TaxID=2630693 RepID=UPI000C55D35F|nr:MULTISPECIES: hypothetical protein [unclassified Neptuniibacter]MAY41803.1 hypothetical protein [Oceanospirillaceae bacterium]|tara:strand:- start:73 stop:741 length:669 start_codon:yes stop_codon:yes gene_type:complete